MSSKNVDSAASIGRLQLAERMRLSILRVMGSDTPPESEARPEGKGEPISSDALPIEAGKAETAQTHTGSDALLSSGLTGSDALLSSDTLPEDVAQNTDSDVLLSSDALPVKHPISSDALLAKHPISSDTLPEEINWSNSTAYGSPIPENLFYPVLDAGIYELLSKDSASASMLFYWAFTTQRSSVLAITYSKISSQLRFARTRTSRILDRIRESVLFSVKATPKGVFIDIGRLISHVSENYPHSDHTCSSETLPPVCSSSIYVYKELKKTTTYTSSETLPIWKSMQMIEFRVLVDLISFYGYGTKDISPKLTELLANGYRNRGLENIALNLSYAASNKKVGSPIGYLMKTLAEDYGPVSLPYEEQEKTKKVAETFRAARNGSLGEYGSAELKKMLFVLGKATSQLETREQCEKMLSELLSKSDGLYKKMSETTGRAGKI
jgi:hypothetical protein